MERFRPMRRKDRELGTKEAYAILESGEYGILSTFGGEYPYGVPVNYVLHGNSLYIHSAQEGHKIENLLEYPRVSFTVVGKSKVLPEELSTAYESVIVFGRASLVDGEEKRMALWLLGKKYAPGNERVEKHIEEFWEATAVIKIAIEHLSGKSRREK